MFVFFLNSFSTNVLFYLMKRFYLNFSVYHQNLSFFTKLAISLFPAKFACAKVAAKFTTDNSLNSGVVIHLS